MKIKAVFYHVGNLLKVEAGLMALPLLISVIDADGNYLAFLIAIAALLALGFLLTRLGRKDAPLYAREGFTIVGISWLLISLFGALPVRDQRRNPQFHRRLLRGDLGLHHDRATILRDVEALSRSMLFRRLYPVDRWMGSCFSCSRSCRRRRRAASSS